MKNILKSVVTIGALGAMLAVSTGAYFSSSATAIDNIITTGTLAVSVDSAQDDTAVNTVGGATWGAPNAYTVIENGVATGNKFITWSNAAPGDTNSYVVGIRNGQTVPFKFRSQATGEWVSGANFNGLNGCPADAASANDALVQVTNVHQYASDNCEGHIGCENLYYGLKTGPWINTPGLSAGDRISPVGYYFGNLNGSGTDTNTPVVVDPNEFAIYRVDVQLSSAADNCYQGATYNFDLGVEAYQEADPIF